MLKKIFMVMICVILIVFTTAIVPYNEQKAEASTFAIAGMAVSATAVYILTTLAVGALATAVGIEYGDEINAHAKRLWDGASTTIKESFASALSLSTDGLFNLSGTLKTWFQNASKSIVNTYALVSTATGTVINPSTSTAMIPATGGSNNSYLYSQNFTLASDKLLTINVNGSLQTLDRLSINIFSLGTIQIYTFDGNRYNQLSRFIPGHPNSMDYYDLRGNLGVDAANSILVKLRNATSPEQILSVLNSVGFSYSAVMSRDAFNNYYNTVFVGLNDVFGTGTLGLNLPSDDLYLPKAVNGQTLVRNPDGTYSYPSGAVYSGELVFELPNTVVLDVDGLRVPVIPLVDFPGYYINVKTGQIIATQPVEGDVPFPPGVVVPPSALPPEMKPDKATKKLNLLPLQMAGDALKTKFPFSIPFDFTRQIGVFDVAPSTPKISIDKPNFVNIGGKSIPLKFEINFSMFDELAAATRWILIIAFDIGLILMIRRLMPE